MKISTCFTRCKGGYRSVKIYVYTGAQREVFFTVGCGHKCLKSHWYTDSIGENPEGMRKHHSGGDCSGAEVGGRRLHAMAELSGMTRCGTGSGTDVARWQFG